MSKTMKATKRGLLAVTLVLVLAAVPMATALADDEVPVTCSLFLAVVAPGTDEVERNKITNSDQVAAGVLDCDVDALDGVLTTLHGSKVKFDEAGNFSGKLEGDYTLETASGILYGEIEAHVVGLMAVPGDPSTVYYEAIQGKWELDGSTEGKGYFAIELSPIDLTGDGIPDTLGGIGALTGSVESSDD